jgi:hypothetical protein
MKQHHANIPATTPANYDDYCVIGSRAKAIILLKNDFTYRLMEYHGIPHHQGLNSLPVCVAMHPFQNGMAKSDAPGIAGSRYTGVCVHD